MIRVIGGRFRGRSLIAPAGAATRPTADRARQALFDVLSHASWAPEFGAARVIDLFAGSGALGLEALSRGAPFCLFVETAEEARAAVRSNIEALGLFGVTRLHRRDAVDLGQRPSSAGPPFNLAFLDPPYASGLGPRALRGLGSGGWLSSGAICVLERGRGEAAAVAPDFTVLDVRAWGAAEVTFLAFDPPGGGPSGA